MNRSHIETLANLVLANLPTGGSVGILGLSYKPNTHVCTASTGIELARRLQNTGVPVRVFDPAALDEARRDLGETVTYASSASACARQSDVLVVCVAWSEFAKLSADDFLRPNHRPTVIDCWRILNRRELESTANIIVLGMGSVTREA